MPSQRLIVPDRTHTVIDGIRSYEQREFRLPIEGCILLEYWWGRTSPIPYSYLRIGTFLKLEDFRFEETLTLDNVASFCPPSEIGLPNIKLLGQRKYTLSRIGKIFAGDESMLVSALEREWPSLNNYSPCLRQYMHIVKDANRS